MGLIKIEIEAETYHSGLLGLLKAIEDYSCFKDVICEGIGCTFIDGNLNVSMEMTTDNIKDIMIKRGE